MKRGGRKSSAVSKLAKKKNADNRQAKMAAASSARFMEYVANQAADGDAPAIRGGLASFRVNDESESDLSQSPIAEDPEFARCIRLLAKRDPITREKALSSLKEQFQEKPADELKSLVIPWATKYSRIVLDNSRNVRLLLHETLTVFVTKVGKAISPALPILAGPWLSSLHDPVAAVASAAATSFTTAFPKQDAARDYLLPHLIAFAETIFDSSAKKLSESWDSKEESEERHDRMISSCITSISSFSSIPPTTTSLILRFSRSKRIPIRRAVFDFIARHASSWSSPGPSLTIMHDFPATTRRSLWPAIIAISRRFPDQWNPKEFDRFESILLSGGDRDLYAACLPLLQIWLETPPAENIPRRLINAIWAGTETGISTAAMAAFVGCIEEAYSAMEEDERSGLMRDCVWEAVLRSFQRLKETNVGGSREQRFQEARLSQSTFTTLGKYLGYDHEWMEAALIDFSDTILCSDEIIMNEFADLVVAANRPVVNSAVLAKAVSRSEIAPWSLCNRLVGNARISDDLRKQSLSVWREALSSGTIPTQLMQFSCFLNQSSAFSMLSEIASLPILFDFVRHCQSEDPDLWKAIGAQCLQNWEKGADSDEFISCFRKLLSTAASGDCRVALVGVLDRLAALIQQHAVVSSLLDDAPEFRQLCSRARIAISSFSLSSENLFWIGCLSIFADDDDDLHFLWELADLAQKQFQGSAAVYCTVAGKLRQQVIAGGDHFDQVVWAAMIQHLPAPFIEQSLPDSETILASSSGQPLRDACIEVADFLSPMILASLYVVEARFSLDERAGRLLLSRIASKAISPELLDGVIELIWGAANANPDQWAILESLRKLATAAISIAPDSILTRFRRQPATIATSALLPALDKDMVSEAVAIWIQNCLHDQDRDSSARCLSAAILAGFGGDRDVIWHVVGHLSDDDARIHLMGAAIRSFPINAADTKIVDAIAWIADALEDEDAIRTDLALFLLTCIIEQCGSTAILIQEAIDLCLPLLSPQSLPRLSSASLRYLREVVAHIDLGTIPDHSRRLLLANLLSQMESSPNAAMSALAYELISRALIAHAASVVFDENAIPTADRTKLAKSLIPPEIQTAMETAPAMDAPASVVRRYLLVWLAFIDLFAAVDADRREMLTSHLQYSVADAVAAFFQELMEQILGSPPISPAFLLESNSPLNPARIPPYLRRLRCSPRLFGALASHVYYRALRTFPVLARLWYASCERSAGDAFRKATAKRFTPLLVQDEMAALNNAATDCGDFQVKCSRTGEIVAALRHSEVTVRLTIRLAAEHPLRTPQVDLSGTKGVDAKRAKWWNLNINRMMASRNGSVQDAIWLWRRNVESHFAGVEECPICYAILHAVTDQLPRLSCRVCKHRFHAACLYKWFSSSSGSTCPLCRSVF